MLVVYQSGWFCFVGLLVNLSVSYEWDRLSLGKVKVRRFGLGPGGLRPGGQGDWGGVAVEERGETGGAEEGAGR